MPRTKKPPVGALAKLLRADALIAEAESMIRSVTVEELGKEGYGDPNPLSGEDRAETEPVLRKAIDVVYDVYGYATALKIVRRSLEKEYLI